MGGRGGLRKILKIWGGLGSSASDDIYNLRQAVKIS